MNDKINKETFDEAVKTAYYSGAKIGITSLVNKLKERAEHIQKPLPISYIQVIASRIIESLDLELLTTESGKEIVEELNNGELL